MPNLQQIISLRRKYAPQQQITNAFNLEDANILEEHLQNEEVKKAIVLEHLHPLYEHVPITKYFSVTPEKQTPEIIKYFEQQRKVIVVLLFIDITGFASKTSKSTPLDITNWLDDYYHDLMPIIYKHGGEIEKIMGDGIICIFGEPFLIAKDCSEKYVRAEACAKEIIEQFKGTKNEVKIALHNGPVIYYKTPVEYYEEYTMIGNTLTELYRLESASKSNSINFFTDKYYFRLIKHKPLGINITDERYWKYEYNISMLQGIGKKEIGTLTRV